MAAIRYEAQGAAREPDGGTPGRTNCCLATRAAQSASGVGGVGDVSHYERDALKCLS